MFSNRPGAVLVQAPGKLYYGDRVVAEIPPAIGHNRPPTLAEELAQETIEISDRAHELVICADERSEVVDDETAARATQLAAMMKACYEDIEDARVKRKEPFLEGGREIDRYFHGLIEPLAGAEPKKRLGGALGDLMTRIDQFRKRREAEAKAEQQRLAEEARKREEEAAAMAQQAERANDPAAQEQATQAQRKALDEASRLHAQSEAAAIVARRPIDSGVGPKAGVRKSYAVEIYDYGLALPHCLAIDGPAIREAALQIYQRQVRAGVRILPGARIIEDTRTTLRRK